LSGTLGFGQDLGFPRLDVYETENEVVASCEVPGLDKREDVNIDIDNNVLTVSGTINRTHEAKEERRCEEAWEISSLFFFPF
jgi:HSP20 family protein